MLWAIHEANIGDYFETVEVAKVGKDGKAETNEATNWPMTASIPGPFKATWATSRSSTPSLPDVLRASILPFQGREKLIQSTDTPLALIGAAHFSISLLTKCFR
jgi:hypothetical protein